MFHGLGRAQHPHGLAAAADLDLAAGLVGREAAQGVVDLGRGEAEAVQLVWIDDDVDFAVHAADALDLGHPVLRLQGARDGVVDEPGQADVRHRRPRDRVGQDRFAIDVGALDRRRVDVPGQAHAGLIDPGADLVGHLLHVFAERELDLGGRDPARHGRLYGLHVRQARHGGLDRAGDLGLDLGRRRPVLGDGDHHVGEGDVGPLLDRQLHVRSRAQRHEGDEQDGHRDGVLDPPGRYAELGHQPAARSGFTRSPGSTKEAARSSTQEPAGGPWTSST